MFTPALRFDWFIGLPVPLIIAFRDYTGFGSSTLNRKLLHTLSYFLLGMLQ